MTKLGVSLDQRESLEGNLMDGKEGAGIHVVLDERIADHDVPHLQSLGDPSRDTGEKDSGDF